MQKIHEMNKFEHLCLRQSILNIHQIVVYTKIDVIETYDILKPNN